MPAPSTTIITNPESTSPARASGENNGDDGGGGGSGTAVIAGVLGGLLVGALVAVVVAVVIWRRQTKPAGSDNEGLAVQNPSFVDPAATGLTAATHVDRDAEHHYEEPSAQRAVDYELGLVPGADRIRQQRRISQAVNASGGAKYNSAPQYESVDYEFPEIPSPYAETNGAHAVYGDGGNSAAPYADLGGGHTVYGHGVPSSSVVTEINSGKIRRSNRKTSTYGFDNSADESIEI